MELADYIRILRARWWLVAIPMIALTLGAFVIGLVEKPLYQGVAQVLVTQQDVGVAMSGLPQGSASYTARDYVQTQVEVIGSLRIASAVIESLALGGDAGELLRGVDVSADTGTNIVQITVKDAEAQRAARIATAFAQEYVTWSRDSMREGIRAAATDVEERLGAAQNQLVAAETVVSAPGATGADQVRLDSARTLYATLAERLEDLRVAEQLATGTGSVLSTAPVDPVSVSPKRGRNAALALTVGLLMGLGVAFLAEQLDHRIRSAEEAGEVYDAPVLVNMPADRARSSEQLLTARDRPDDPTTEAYRMLRNSLGFINIDKNIKTLLVTSAMPSEGKSTLAANLAAVLSQSGSSVMLVVCDFRVRAAERFFEIDRSMGLSNVLLGTVPLWAAIQQPAGFENLRVLAGGTMPPNPSELLGSAAMGRLMAELRDTYDWVIIDSAPVLAAADAAAVVPWIDGVLVVAELGRSRRDFARAGREQLAMVGARILGVTVWGAKTDVMARSYYAYQSRQQPL